MATKKRQSALILTPAAWEVLQKYRGAYGVKNTLSVGLELFDALDQPEQFRRVTASHAADAAVRRAEAEAAKQQRKTRHGRTRQST